MAAITFPSFQAELNNHRAIKTTILDQLSEQLGARNRRIHKDVEGGIVINVVPQLYFEGVPQDEAVDAIMLDPVFINSSAMNSLEGQTLQARHDQGYYGDTEWTIRFADTFLGSSKVPVKRNIVLFAKIDW